ncbi:MAG: hypothetical protein ROR55_17805 [Devosia sp.]
MTQTTNTQANPQTAPGKRPSFIAYHVPERENAPWARLGAAWDHDDGKGFTLQLDLIPVADGRIVLRTYEPKPKAETPPQEAAA